MDALWCCLQGPLLPYTLFSCKRKFCVFLEGCLLTQVGVCCRAKDLIQKLLVVEPAQRLSADAALLHPWMAQHSSLQAPAGDLTGALENLREFRDQRT